MSVRVCHFLRRAGLREGNSEDLYLIPSPGSLPSQNYNWQCQGQDHLETRGWVGWPRQSNLDPWIFFWLSWAIIKDVSKVSFIGSKQTLQRVSMEMKEKQEASPVLHTPWGMTDSQSVVQLAFHWVIHEAPGKSVPYLLLQPYLLRISDSRKWCYVLKKIPYPSIHLTL